MGAYTKLYLWKKFIESFLIHAVDISISIHSNHNVVVVGLLGWLTMGNLRCFPSLNFPLLASIWNLAGIDSCGEYSNLLFLNVALKVHCKLFSFLIHQIYGFVPGLCTVHA